MEPRDVTDADKIADLLNLLREARWYVDEYKPQSNGQVEDANNLLMAIDDVLPVIPALLYEYCDDPQCSRPKGHLGDHDDIPF